MPFDHDLLNKLNWRYAVQKFDPAKIIPAHDLDLLQQALIMTPSSFGLQPWKFIFITDPQLRQQLRRASYNQSQITDASHLVVLCQNNRVSHDYVEKYIARIMAVRHVEASSLEGFRRSLLNFVSQHEQNFDMQAWANHQVYIALGNLLTSAAVLGIDACPMEGLDAGRYDDILSLKDKGLHTCCAAAIGYRASDDKYAHLAKVRFEKSEIIASI